MTLVIVVFGVYYAVLLLLLVGWHKATDVNFPAYHEHMKISVVVPFRDEEKNIGSLVRDLIVQSYNHEYFEVILCNDHSADHSTDCVRSAIAGVSNFKLIHSPGAGKKEALVSAIAASAGDLIVTTDADCIVPENWLARINHAFQDRETKMVFGGVAMRRPRTFFSGLQSMEFSSLVGSAGAAAGLGFPILCNGANLAFRKSVFQEVLGYEGNLNIPSGDDEFLLRKIIRQYPAGIRFLNTEDSVVATQSLPTVSAFIHQRIRWAGKWRYNASAMAVTVAISILLFQLFFTGLVLAVALDLSLARTVIPLIAVKLLLEFIFLFRCSSFLGLRWSTLDFLTLQFLYPLYVIFIGVASNFMAYEWKGRKWKHKVVS